MGPQRSPWVERQVADWLKRESHTLVRFFDCILQREASSLDPEPQPMIKSHSFDLWVLLAKGSQRDQDSQGELVNGPERGEVSAEFYLTCLTSIKQLLSDLSPGLLCGWSIVFQPVWVLPPYCLSLLSSQLAVIHSHSTSRPFFLPTASISFPISLMTWLWWLGDLSLWITFFGITLTNLVRQPSIFWAPSDTDFPITSLTMLHLDCLLPHQLWEKRQCILSTNSMHYK